MDVQEDIVLDQAGEKEKLLNPLLTSIIAVLIVGTLFEYWYRNTRTYKLLKNFPTIPQLPIIGSAHLLVNLSTSELLQFVLKMWESLKSDVGYVRIGTFNAVFLVHPVDVELILSNTEHNEKSHEYRYFQPWFGDGLLISNGQHWKHHRKMMAPTFHQSILKSFVPTFAKLSQSVSQSLEQIQGKEFDVHKKMSEASVQILLSTAMGMRELPDAKTCSDYAQSVMDMCDIINKRQMKPQYMLDSVFNKTSLKDRSDKLLNTILTLTRRVVSERKMNFNEQTDGVLEEKDIFQSEPVKQQSEGLRDDLDDIDENDVGSKRRLALLDAMVQMTKDPSVEWTEKDVFDEVNTIMFEGHDTTASGSSFVLLALALHKDIQQKVLEEQKTIFGDDFQRECTFADTLEMNYLERVIKEAIRMFPPVPIIARKTSCEVKLKSGPYTIPKDMTVVIATLGTHRLEQYYENPLKFDPDNFLPENVAKRHYYSYIPFSAGPRSCLGRKYAMLMLKVLLSTLVRNFEVHTTMTEELIQRKLQGDIILKLEGGHRVSLTKRA